MGFQMVRESLFFVIISRACSRNYNENNDSRTIWEHVFALTNIYNQFIALQVKLKCSMK